MESTITTTKVHTLTPAPFPNLMARFVAQVDNDDPAPNAPKHKRVTLEWPVIGFAVLDLTRERRAKPSGEWQAVGPARRAIEPVVAVGLTTWFSGDGEPWGGYVALSELDPHWSNPVDAPSRDGAPRFVGLWLNGKAWDAGPDVETEAPPAAPTP